MTAQRLIVSGRVQGVGYRDWAVSEAARHGVNGWVRNLADGRVELVVSGAAEAVEAFIGATWRGPAGARVVSVLRENASGEAPVGFERRKTE